VSAEDLVDGEALEAEIERLRTEGLSTQDLHEGQGRRTARRVDAVREAQLRVRPSVDEALAEALAEHDANHDDAHRDNAHHDENRHDPHHGPRQGPDRDPNRDGSPTVSEALANKLFHSPPYSSPVGPDSDRAIHDMNDNDANEEVQGVSCGLRPRPLRQGQPPPSGEAT
jgi:hypothetical protein